MDFGPLRTLALNLNFSAHGVDGLVTLPTADEAVAARVLWLTYETEQTPGRGAFTRSEAIKVLALRRSEVPEVPRGTLIVAPDKLGDGETKAFRVDGTDSVYADHQRFTVVVDEAETAALADVS